MTEQYKIDKGVAVITLKRLLNEPSHLTRSAFMQAVKHADSDAAVIGIVLDEIGSGLCRDAASNEAGVSSEFREPDLRTLIALLVSHRKPVVAALHGVVRSDGLELALGCHYRIAEPGCSVTFPEERLGLVLGAVGTEGLPHVRAVDPELKMNLSGEPIKSELLARISEKKLFDKLASSRETLLEEAIALALEMASRHSSSEQGPKARELVCEQASPEAFFGIARKTASAIPENTPAVHGDVGAVETGVTTSLSAGIDIESRASQEVMDTSEAIALRHLVQANHAASVIPDVPENTSVREIKSVAIIGVGTMGCGISINFLNAGIPVTVLDETQEAVDRGIAAIRRIYETQERKGKIGLGELEMRMGLLHSALKYADIGHVDLVIEAVFEDLAIKETVFRKLDEIVKPGAILASNTSTLDLDRIAGFTSRPQDVVGMHFFSPANVMRLLELVRGKRTGKNVLATVMALGTKIGKTCVVAGACDGFIGNRMLDAYFRQAGFMVDEGCSPQQVDAAIEKFGFAMGPFRMTDMAGNDIGWYIRKRRYIERPDVKYSKSADLLCELGRFGQKTGAGWYDYVPGQREPRPSVVVTDLLDAYRKSLGVAVRKISDEEISQRLVYALVNEGARILEEGVASRAGDIDVVYVTGYGFPARCGGPMHYAGRVGLGKVRDAMRRFACESFGDKEFWQPAALIETLADEGRTFSD